MFSKLLIANRGEIACRIIRTARAMGIRTVAVYSDADAKALHVRQADEAVHIGPSPARESYLVGDKIIAAAKTTGAEAIHPGYGFLSENADFAQAVIDAGLVWVGPKPDSIRAMGLKDAAKALMTAAGVPVTPGYMGANQDPAFLAEQAATIGYPVLIKAVAGGGGKGMRKVDATADFPDALDSCKRESASSFGNDVVLIEKWIESPRHIEVQVFGDSHGNVVHLFERDCSLQRRHQKVIEEAPAPGMDAATREAVCGAAVKAASAVNYEGAGTIEFIADASQGLRADRIWFMEMNTRLQVEHPVTEEITGVDLVEWQLRVASGEKLPLKQHELSINGHAIEARLYAEDPAKGFLPSVGKLRHFEIEPDRMTIGRFSEDLELGAFRGNDENWVPPPPLRLETGVERGDEISPFYDPMIAKLVVHSDSRDLALNRLASICDRVEVWPVHTNAAFLAKLLREPSVNAGTATTGFIAEHIDELIIPETLPASWASVGLTLLGGPTSALSFGGLSEERPTGFRLNSSERATATVLLNGNPMEARPGPDVSSHITPEFFAGSFRDGEQIILFYHGQPFSVSLSNRPSVGAAAGDGAIISPMPGRVTAVEVAAGDAVTKGQRLLTLEAMKMEHGLVAPFDGVVAEVNAAAGAQVGEGAVLVRVTAETK